MADEQELRSEIRWLGELLGDVLREQAGDAAFALVEQVRALAKARRAGEAGAEATLGELIRSLNEAELASLVQALSMFFDLANLAEDHPGAVAILRQIRQIEEHAQRLHQARQFGLVQ